MDLREKLPLEIRSAVQRRERGDLKSARKIFENVLRKAEELKKSPDIDDQDAYIGIMGEWIIQLRHEGKRKLEEALDVAISVYEYNQKHQRDNPNALRGVSNTNIDLENYEIATGYLKETIALLPESDSARKGEAMSHLAKCLFRTGKVDNAEKVIEESLRLIDQNTAGMKPMFIAVWKSHALKVKALILNSEGRHKEAMLLAKRSLAFAQKFRLAIRTREAEEAIRSINGST